MIQTETTSRTARERETSALDAEALTYLTGKHVFDTPSRATCKTLLNCFLQHVYPFLPIVDPTTLRTNYDDDPLPTFLLYTISTVAAPYLSPEHLSSTGYPSITTAQTEFFTRAKLLYDSGCEQSELVCLQASVLLGSFQHSLDSTKNSRLWFANAVRLAKQMSLHRKDIESEVDHVSYCLYQRIWWTIRFCDAFLVISGLEDALHVSDEQTDTRPVDAFDQVSKIANAAADAMEHSDAHILAEACQWVQRGKNSLYAAPHH
ncbi:hypothetical protein E8E12_011185 [Didymella heteroderae]|uniref:Xylanolytic transcriptional activator regulatory domain-containing protein n=1 Tax=Didymella heteroderae TaxID=1769908 RepID=A0A9P4WZQ5_9PLEO|nr:hypothetical protein E8E12_011185 [Didymella heteroderae]